MKHLMLLRFSALGDILMSVPIVELLARQYPDVRITVVSRPYVGSIFARLPENVCFLGINPRMYPGLMGLNRLYQRLKALQPTHVCDLHDVLRTKFLRLRFALAGVPTSHIVKDRRARKAFIRQQPKRQQVTSFERYAAALAKAGFPIRLSDELPPLFSAPRTPRSVGVAPFAAHKGKIYPLEKMEEVVQRLAGEGMHVYLFGAGEREKKLMDEWAARHEGVESMVGRLPDMAAEAELMASLQVMLTMDSGNMHLAALTATPVVSIWGATHPLGGFLGWRQGMAHVIQRTDLDCRPCSIYGQKACHRGGYPCLCGITPQDITHKIMELCE